MQRLPLAGLRVVDFTTILAGPHITQWLGVMGAEVIKIETHLRAESRLVSVLAKKPRRMGLNESDSFAIHNYSKKSVTLNMKAPAAIELVKRLIAKSDIVAENFSGGVMERWGLGYDDLKTLKDDLIVYAGSGYGRTGPRKLDPIYAPIADAANGLVDMNGYLGGEPYTLGSSGWSDISMALHGTFAILAAIRHRQETGEGQFIDTAMIEVEAQFLGDDYLDHRMNGRTAQRRGNSDGAAAPHGCYPCKGEDNWVAISVASQADWQAFRAALGDPAWAADPKFADELSRWHSREALDADVAAWTRERSPDEVMTLLQAAGVAAGASLDLEEVMADRQLNARGFFHPFAHAVMPPLTFSGLPLQLSDTEDGDYFPSPLLGEHNDYVFGELLGLPTDEIRRLEAEQILY